MGNDFVISILVSQAVPNRHAISHMAKSQLILAVRFFCQCLALN